ncbi:MAG: asparaginase [Shimia sp.]
MSLPSLSPGVPLIEVIRGDLLESLHSGHVAVVNTAGELVESWGDPTSLIFPRSSCKMIQALPLIRSGAADAYDLTTEHLALTCASHQGAAIHTTRVASWLEDLGLSDDALRCGPQEPNDREARDALIRTHAGPCQIHNNCSGKHAGFLTLAQHLGAGPEYADIDHPVQRAVRAATEEATGEDSPTWATDGCSAPNFATTLTGLARAMAGFAAASEGTAEHRLHTAMTTHPELVAGESRACTELMRAAPGVALKTGAEAVFTAILPKQGLGIALKITDGAFRASEAAITHLLIRYGALEANHPAALKRLGGPIRNWRGIATGYVRIASDFG